MKIFDKSRPTCLATDWSKQGTGFWLLQKHCKCEGAKPFCCQSGWKTTLVGSRFTHPAESRYAPVEGEALAVADALDKARYFVLGCNDLIVAVDHKPLLKIFGDRSLENISNSHLRNLKEKTLRYRFRMVHLPGLLHRAADSVSRHPTGDAEKMTLIDDTSESESIDACLFTAAISSLNYLSINSVSWDKVKIATTSDSDMHQHVTMIEHCVPES